MDARPPASRPRAWQIAWLAGFTLLLCGPALAWLARVPPPAAMQELRELAPYPDARKTPLAQWPAKFEAWLRDHYALRGHLIRAHSVVRHRWLRAPANNVIVGRDDWLLYSGERTVEDFMGRDAFSPAQLDQWLAVLEGRRAWLRERGITYLFVFAPNKSTIYPEQMPAALARRAQPGKLDQLLAHLRTHASPVESLDLRPALLEQKRTQRLYWTADSHWNAHGLIAATDAILARLRGMGLDAGAGDWRDALKIETVPRIADCADLLAMRDLWPAPPEAQVRLARPADLRDATSPLASLPPWDTAPWWKKPVTTERASARGRAVVLSDSFFRAGGVPLDAIGHVPFEACFRRFTGLWEWATFDQIREIAEHEKPDVVIEAWTERFLKVIPADHPEFVRARVAAGAVK